MIGITAAVNFLHKNRILHRNLNPKVIWLDDKFYPKIFDFSTSREVNTLETDSGLTIPEIDIISYQSTEILNDKPFGSSTDIFSLARLLYYFITGYEPFKMKEDPLRKASVFQLGPSIKKNCHPLFPENINPELKDLLIRCWSNPDSRPTANEVYYNLIWNENCRIVDSFEGEISFPLKITHIPEKLFYENNGDFRFVFHNYIKSIGDHAFHGAGSYFQLRIPNSVEYMKSITNLPSCRIEEELIFNKLLFFESSSRATIVLQKLK